MFKNLKQSFSIPLSVWMIGWADLLLKLSSVMVFGLSGLYMTNSLGATVGLMAVIESSVESVANLTKLFSGIISDYFMRRKSIMVLGFALATIARPILALFPSIHAVVLSRILDRLANGIMSAPRDALVGDLAPENLKGACFGFRSTMATAGSFLGGIASYFLLKHTNNDYTFSFWIAAIPAILGLIILLIFVKEPNHDEINDPSIEIVNHRHPLHFSDLKRLGGYFWGLIALVSLFYLARLGENVLIQHANKNFGYSEAQAQLILSFYNGANALLSYPIGVISDRVPRLRVLMLGVCCLIAADALLYTASNDFAMFLGVCLWGIQIGVSQNMFTALIIDKIPADLRGTGIGIFCLVMSISLFLCGLIAKGILDATTLNLGFTKITFDPTMKIHYTFLMSGCVASLSLIMVYFFGRKHAQQSAPVVR
ncbi:MAG: hypothetical protein HEEMFOPI_01376 [Holosporales bacterium]